MVWLEGNMSLKNPVTPPGIDPGTFRLVAQRLNHYVTPGPHFHKLLPLSEEGMSVSEPRHLEKIMTYRQQPRVTIF
jgi:hypothetical protein